MTQHLSTPTTPAEDRREATDTTRPTLRRTAGSVRAMAAMAAAVMTLGLLQSISASFLSVPAAQLAKVSSASVLVASVR